jgi:type IV pilus assembly protein PilF
MTNWHLWLKLILCLWLAGCAANKDALSSHSIDRQQAANARTELGIAYLQVGEPEKAILNLSLAYKYAPDDLTTNLALAHYYTTTSDFTQAEFHYLRMLKSHPNDVHLVNNYASLMCQTGRSKEAIANFEHLTSLTEGMASLSGLRNAALCALQTQQFVKMRQFAVRMLMIDPNNAFAHQLLIDRAIWTNEHKRAYRLLQRYRSVNNNHLPDHYLSNYLRLSAMFNP